MPYKNKADNAANMRRVRDAKRGARIDTDAKVEIVARLAKEYDMLAGAPQVEFIRHAAMCDAEKCPAMAARSRRAE